MQTLTGIGEWIKQWWGYIAAVIGICGAVYKYIVQPILRKRKKAQEERDAFQHLMMGKIEGIGKEIGDLKMDIEEVSKDVGYLQHDRLQQGHDHYMQIGYCPPGDKENLTMMYDRYIARGRNSLYKSYKEDLLNLPNTPNGHWGARPNESRA